MLSLLLFYRDQINICKLHSVYWLLCPIKIIPTGILHTSIKCTNNFNCCLLIYAWWLNPLDPLQNGWHGLNSLTRLFSQPHSDGDMLADGGDAQKWHRSCYDMFMLLGRDVPHWWIMKTCTTIERRDKHEEGMWWWNFSKTKRKKWLVISRD